MGFQPPPGYPPQNPYQQPYPGAAAVTPYGQGYSDKSRGTAFILSYFLGWFGVDRFYVGHTLLGILKLLTFGGFGLWMLIDNVLFALGAVKDAQGRPLQPPPTVGNPKVIGSHVLLIGYFAGNFGVDRFMTGQVGLGIAKLLTCGGCGIWWLVDVILCATGALRDKDGNSLKWD